MKDIQTDRALWWLYGERDRCSAREEEEEQENATELLAIRRQTEPLSSLRLSLSQYAKGSIPQAGGLRNTHAPLYEPVRYVYKNIFFFLLFLFLLLLLFPYKTAKQTCLLYSNFGQAKTKQNRRARHQVWRERHKVRSGRSVGRLELNTQANCCCSYRSTSLSSSSQQTDGLLNIYEPTRRERERASRVSLNYHFSSSSRKSLFYIYATV